MISKTIIKYFFRTIIFFVFYKLFLLETIVFKRKIFSAIYKKNWIILIWGKNRSYRPTEFYNLTYLKLDQIYLIKRSDLRFLKTYFIK